MGGISKAGLFAGLIFASSILLSSCVSTNAGRTEQAGQTETTVAFSDNDFRMAAELLVEDFANSTAVRNYRTESEALPCVLVGEIKNRSGTHIDTAKLGRRFQTAIVNNGTMKNVSDSEKKFARLSEDDFSDFIDTEALKDAAQNAGIDFYLQGSVTSSFYLDMIALDAASGSVLWQGQTSLSKPSKK